MGRRDRTIRCTGAAGRAGSEISVVYRGPVNGGVMFSRRMTMLRYFLVASLLAGFAGCSFDFTGPKSDVTTTSPTIDQVKYCRDVMYINPELEIDPVGYSIETGMDDVIRFKFIAKTDDPSILFDASRVDTAKFSDDFILTTLNPQASETWWDLSSQQVTGASFTVPPPGSKGTRGLNIAYTKNEDGTLTVYVLWHET